MCHGRVPRDGTWLRRSICPLAFTPPTPRATVPHDLLSATRLDRIVETLPRAYPGPGGAIAALRDGEVLLRHAWGWANAERRIPFTPRTLFRMCSITKQFTCAVVLDAFPDPSVLDGDVRARLPLLEQPAPGALHLCHNQSGLRDYWAVAMLHGSPAEAPFGDAEAARVIAGTRTLHFAPGTRHSYVNQNFRMLSDIVQDRTGRGFAELLRTSVFERAGMATAFLAADTRAMPDGTEGYEGTPAGGFRAAENRILWTGDAGLGASLDDMIAWERHIDATRDDAGSLYRRLSAPVRFADGAPAVYGFGLSRGTELGRPVTAHGGALRGWRSHRMHVPSERVSVVVMFNHLADAHDAAVDLLAAVLGEERPPPAAAAAGARLARRLYRAGDRPRRCASMRRMASSACATATSRTASACTPTARPAATTAACGFAPPMAGCGWTARSRTRPRACVPSTARPPRTSPAATAARSWTPS